MFCFPDVCLLIVHRVMNQIRWPVSEKCFNCALKHFNSG